MSEAVDLDETEEVEGELEGRAGRIAEMSGDRHLTFELAEQVYGIPLERVQEIVRVQRATTAGTSAPGDCSTRLEPRRRACPVLTMVGPPIFASVSASWVTSLLYRPIQGSF